MSERKWFNVGVVKIPHAERDIARDALGERPDERFRDFIGADTPDHDHRYPVGSHCTYQALLTDEEAARFAEASNCRYIREDVPLPDGFLGTSHPSAIPDWRTRAAVGYWPGATTAFPGTGVNVAILDGGTSSALRGWMGYTLVARGVYSADVPPVNEPLPGDRHASLCASAAIPPGGRLIDVVIADDGGTTFESHIASGIMFAVAHGAQVVSMSFGWTLALPTVLDAMTYAADFDVVFYASAGNQAGPDVLWPGRYSYTGGLSYVYSVCAWDASTNYLWDQSSWDAQVTGMAPGAMVLSVDDVPLDDYWYGTSVSVPTVANLCTRLISKGVTARAAGAALAATTQDMGIGALQGGGMFNFRAAAERLHLVPPAPAVVDPGALWSGASS